MDNLLELLSHEAWNGVAALIAVMALVLPLFAKAIKSLSSNQKMLGYIKNIASIALIV